MPRFHTREAWLEEATRVLLALFPEGTVLPPIKVSVGWPKGGRGGHVLGQCWYPDYSADTKTAHIFLAPDLIEVVDVVLPVLLHEVIHTLTPEAKHKGAFVKMAKSVGLCKPFTAATSTPELSANLRRLATQLGEYPHVALRRDEVKKQPTRLLLWSCPCGDTFRRTMKNKHGKVARARCLDCGGMYAPEKKEEG